MNKKPGFFQKAEKALAGKGFYMVLLLCLVILGASGYFLYRTVSDIGANSTQSASAPAEVTVTTPADQETEPVSQTETVEEQEDPQPSTSLEDSKQTAAQEEAQQVLEPSATEEAVPVDNPSEEEDAAVDAQPESQEVAAPQEEVTAEAENVPAALSWPVEGDVVAAFSSSELTYNQVMGDWRTHNGLDISAALGTEVLAAADGAVESISNDPVTGTTLTLTHSGGMTTVYGNLDPDTLSVAVGDSVTAGQALACVGSSAGEQSGEGAFLHFAVTVDGESVNPQDYLLS